MLARSGPIPCERRDGCAAAGRPGWSKLEVKDNGRRDVHTSGECLSRQSRLGSSASSTRPTSCAPIARGTPLNEDESIRWGAVPRDARRPLPAPAAPQAQDGFLVLDDIEPEALKMLTA